MFSGSHDSFSNWLDKNGPVGSDCDNTVRELSKFLGPLMKDILCRWGLTQSLDVTSQLCAGIRYFDLRISSKPNTEDVYLIHGLFSYKLESILEDINKFLESHPKEVILLDFNHFYDMTEFQHKQCMSMILEYLGYKMCPLLDMDSITLDTLWDSNLQTVVFYHSPLVKENHQFWPGRLIPSPWPNVCDSSNMVDFLEKKYQQGRNKGSFYVTQGILTPDTKFILKHVTGSLKSTMCEKAAAPFVTWLKTKTAGQNGINVCLMDFVEFDEYIPCVIGLNNTNI